MSNPRLMIVAVVALAAFVSGSRAVHQDKKATRPAERTDVKADKPTRAELEKRFQDMLTGAVLKGTWQMTRGKGLEGKAPLSEPKPDKYTIDSARKIGGDRWVIIARIEYADKNVKVPIPVRVVWAEDTAIITLDEFAVPMIGTYSARVMIYRNFYAGTWFGSDYGGVLSGQIVRQSDEEAAEPAPKTRPAEEPKPPRPDQG